MPLDIGCDGMSSSTRSTPPSRSAAYCSNQRTRPSGRCGWEPLPSGCARAPGQHGTAPVPRLRTTQSSPVETLISRALLMVLRAIARAKRTWFSEGRSICGRRV